MDIQPVTCGRGVSWTETFKVPLRAAGWFTDAPPLLSDFTVFKQTGKRPQGVAHDWLDGLMPAMPARPWRIALELEADAGALGNDFDKITNSQWENVADVGLLLVLGPGAQDALGIKKASLDQAWQNAMTNKLPTAIGQAVSSPRGYFHVGYGVIELD